MAVNREFNMLRSLLSHPLIEGMDIDAPITNEIRWQIIQTNPFLHKVYTVWYRKLVDSLPTVPGKVLELGSGAGFLDQFIPGLITSDILYYERVSSVLSGLNLPFPSNALSSIVMLDVFHHLPEPRRFFHEAARCIRPGGVITMIEPWNTPWSSVIFTHLHHEPFVPTAAEWEFPSTGPLSASNQALPWIIFERDRDRFDQDFPFWKLEKLELFMPFSYLLSGGVSMRRMTPTWSFPIWNRIERSRLLKPSRWAMFAHIVLRRVAA